LIITHNPQYHGYIDVNSRVVDELNRRHTSHSNESFVSRSKGTRQIWFEELPMPEDAWEKIRERKIASGEWPAPKDCAKPEHT
jgi:hypothetical protein